MGQDNDNDLSARIEAARERAGLQAKNKDNQTTESSSAASLALRYGAEFASAVIVALLIGLGIDHVFGTRPWGVLILLGFGLAAGVLGVIRAYQQLTATFADGNDDSSSDQGM